MDRQIERWTKLLTDVIMYTSYTTIRTGLDSSPYFVNKNKIIVQYIAPPFFWEVTVELILVLFQALYAKKVESLKIY